MHIHSFLQPDLSMDLYEEATMTAIFKYFYSLINDQGAEKKELKENLKGLLCSLKCCIELYEA